MWARLVRGDGEKIRMEVMNPDTLELIEEFDLR